MCLIVKKETEKQIAVEDIIVYKRLLFEKCNGLINAEYYPFCYELNVLYTTEIKSSDNFQYFDDKSHYGISTLGVDKLIPYGEGFHSAFKKNRLHKKYGTDIFQCTVPMGSEYYQDRSGLLVSNQIIINKIV